MKIPDKFLCHDFLKLFHKCEVGFYIDDIQPYNRAMASIRIRCYDIIEYFEKCGIHAELYKPFKDYKAVIFTKTCSDRAVRTAKKLHEKGVPIYYEAYCEFLEDESRRDDRERINILKIAEQAQVVGTASPQQAEAFSKYHPKVLMIPESVHDDFFRAEKKHEPKERVTLVYCGYSGKAKDTLCIREVLLKLQKKYRCRLLYICEKDPKLTDFEYEYLEYKQSEIPDQLLQGDIMIAPRPMNGIGQSAHSFTKVALPLAAGLPAVASPVPSYVGTPVILCRNDEEWTKALTRLITDAEERRKIGKQGREYVKDNFSLQKIGEEYRKLFVEMTGGR